MICQNSLVFNLVVIRPDIGPMVTLHGFCPWIDEGRDHTAKRTMNVYACCYRGNLGYGCRIRGRRWMFVPELGQRDRHVHRNVALGDLRFADPFAQTYERNQELPLTHRGFSNWLRGIHPRPTGHSVGGLLLTNA